MRGGGVRATLFLDGTVLITGGNLGFDGPTASADLFDPDTNQFTAVGPMAAARENHFAVLIDDGAVLVGGGTDADGLPGLA